MEEQILKLAGGSGLVTILIIIIKFFFDYLRKNDARTDNVVNELKTTNEVYELLRKEIALLREEVNLKKQEIEIANKKLIILEALAYKNGIDIYEEYKKHGIGEK